jgi:adenine-specific DNA-methyltransferase
MIKYIGSKRKLVGDILTVANSLQHCTSIIDLFSGTSRVGHAFKKAGYQVFSNDHNSYAYSLAVCYVEANKEDVTKDAEKLIQEFNRMPGQAGYFTDTFCVKSRFFKPKNGKRIDAIREAIEAKQLNKTLKHVLLVSLMEAADRVDSTCGLQMAYLRQWAPRAHNDLKLRMPNLLHSSAFGKCKAYNKDAHEIAQELSADITYLDPPYNQHSYLSNYHIWESLVTWDKPPVYGTACKRIDCKDRKSDFNSKKHCALAFKDVYTDVDSGIIIVSFNDEGHHSRKQMEEILQERGPVVVISKDNKRYIGAQIGIYNLQGIKVGKISHLRNTEYIYIVITESGRRNKKLYESFKKLEQQFS